MRNSIEVISVSTVKNKVICTFTVQGELNRYFNQNYMIAEYEQEMEDVPNSISIIPFLSNILPIVWFSNGDLIIDEIDKVYFKSIQNIKQGFENMYDLSLGGNITFKKLVKNEYDAERNSISLFSGGVDSLSTVVSNISDEPILATIWGSDIDINNYEAWNKVKNDVNKSADKLGLENIFIKSDFRRVINEANLDVLCREKTGFNYWWENIQHGMALLGHLAPVCYKNKIGKIYIPGTLSECYKKKIGKTKLASDPSIDNQFKFSSCITYHDGFEYNRQQKIVNIIGYKKYTGYDIDIRVCFSSYDGENCCRCKKCSTTILGIIQQKMDPNKFGFKVDEIILNNIKNSFNNEFVFSKYEIDRLLYLKEEFRKDINFWSNYKAVSWIMNIDTSNEFNEFKKLKLNLGAKNLQKNMVINYLKYMDKENKLDIDKLYRYILNSVNTLDLSEISIYTYVLSFMIKTDYYMKKYNTELLKLNLMYKYISFSRVYSEYFIKNDFENIISDEEDLMYMKMIKILKLRLENNNLYIDRTRELIGNKNNIDIVKIFIDLLNEIENLSDEMIGFNKEFELRILDYFEQNDIKTIKDLIEEYDNNFLGNKLTIKYKSVIKALNGEFKDAECIAKISLINNLFDELNYSCISLMKEIQNDIYYQEWNKINILKS